MGVPEWLRGWAKFAAVIFIALYSAALHADPVQALIVQVAVDGASRASSAPLTLAPGRHRIAFFFSVPDKSGLQGLQFRYKMEDFDREWTLADGGGEAVYINLPHGRYRFRVQSRGTGTSWSDVERSANFSLQPWPWETPAFALIVAMVLVGVFAAAYTRSAKQRRAKERNLLMLLEQRTAALRDSERQVRRARDETEIRIHERTIELVRANHALEAEIHVRRAKEQEMAAATVLGERASQAKTELLASMGRQIHLPIQELIAISESALGTELNPESREMLQRMNGLACTLMRVVDAILGFARMERDARNCESQAETTALIGEEDPKALNLAIL